MSDEYQAEAIARLEMTEDAILEMLGADLAGPQALPLRPSELAERAKRWFSAQREYLEFQVCSSPSIKEFTLSGTDNSAIVIELAQLLAGLVLPVNPVTLAVLLVKKGLKGICSTSWGAQ